MAFVPRAKALVVLQLSLLLVHHCFTVLGESDIVSLTESPHLEGHAPIYPPDEAPKHHQHKKIQPPSHPPVQPPSHPPVQPPNHQHHHHHKKIQPPSHPPVQPPSHPHVQPPTHQHHHHKNQPPSHPPVQPPSHPLPKRCFVAVQGVVYCKSCKYTGVDTLLKATPLAGASVKLQCNNTKNPLVQEAKTDKNGYFFVRAPKTITNFGSHKCKVTLVSSPMATCNKPTNLNAGEQGAILMPQKPPVPDLSHPLPYQMFTVGPFAFEPSTKCSL